MSEKLPTVRYAIDSQDILIDVDENWQKFADANDGGVPLHPQSVIGKSLWELIADDTLQTIYQALIERVRTTEQPSTFDFRCDSPLFRRFMRMTVSLQPPSRILFVSEMLRTERRDQGVHPSIAFTGGKPIRRCSICNLFALQSGKWSEVIGVVEDDSILDQDRPARIIWSVCQPCRDDIDGLRVN